MRSGGAPHPNQRTLTTAGLVAVAAALVGEVVGQESAVAAGALTAGAGDEGALGVGAEGLAAAVAAVQLVRPAALSPALRPRACPS